MHANTPSASRARLQQYLSQYYARHPAPSNAQPNASTWQPTYVAHQDVTQRQGRAA